MSAFTESELDSGIVTLGLIQSWPNWVYRRVDYVTFDDVVTMQVRSSFDFALPAFAHPTGAKLDGTRVVYVPLSLFRKQRMTRFSLRDESNSSLSICTQPKVMRIGAATLVAQAQLARIAAPHLNVPEKMPARIEEALLQIAGARRSVAIRALEKLAGPARVIEVEEASAAWQRLLAHSPRFAALAQKMAEAYFLITPMDHVDAKRRRILKLSYETARLAGTGQPGPFVDDAPSGMFAQGPKAWLRLLLIGSSIMPYPIYLTTGVVGRSRCYHQEAEAPAGLQITGASLSIYKTLGDDKVLGAPDLVFGKLQRAHLHVAGVPANSYGVTELFLRTRISNIARTAWLASGVTVILLIVVALLAALLPASVTSVVALLLVPPAALSAYVARPSEPLVSNAVVFGLKMIAATSALCGSSLSRVGDRDV